MWRTLFVLSLFIALPASAVEIEGIAPFSGDADTAREAAIRDALENAGLNKGASIRGSSQISNQSLTESLVIRGEEVGAYKLVREWSTTSGFYHVIIDVDMSKLAEQKAEIARGGNGQAVKQCSGADYRRKVLTPFVWTMHPEQLPDAARLPTELQSELSRRLQESGQFLPILAGNEAAIELIPGQEDPTILPERIRELARRFGVQFVLGAVLRDTAFEGESYRLTHGPRDLHPGEKKLSLNIPLLDFGAPGIKSSPSSRRFEMDLFVFDGISGAMINRHRFTGKVQGKVTQDPSAIGTQRFYDTSYGQLVQSQLTAAVQAVRDDLVCLPFSARVVQAQSNRIYFDAGSTSRISPGDRMQVYRLRGGFPINSIGMRESMQLGMSEESVGTLTVTEVQPLFSVGHVEGGRSVQVGDYIRFVGREAKR